eukprot:4659708-Pleurochrysis_carterae.AAC.1
MAHARTRARSCCKRSLGYLSLESVHETTRRDGNGMCGDRTRRERRVGVERGSATEGSGRHGGR